MQTIKLKPLVYSSIVDDEASKHGVDIGSLAAGDINAIANLPHMRNASFE